MSKGLFWSLSWASSHTTDGRLFDPSVTAGNKWHHGNSQVLLSKSVLVQLIWARACFEATGEVNYAPATWTCLPSDCLVYMLSYPKWPLITFLTSCRDCFASLWSLAWCCIYRTLPQVRTMVFSHSLPSDNLFLTCSFEYLTSYWLLASGDGKSVELCLFWVSYLSFHTDQSSSLCQLNSEVVLALCG